MFFVKNIISGSFNIKYSKAFNSFMLTNEKSKQCNYTEYKFFSDEDEVKLLLQIYKIGESFNKLIKKQLTTFTSDKYYINYDVIYRYVCDLKKSNDLKYSSYLLYNIYKSLIVNFKLKEIIEIEFPFRFNNEGIYSGDFLIDYIDDSKNQIYIDKLVETILEILNKKKGTPINMSSCNISSFIFDYDISKYINNNFSGVRNEYRNLIRALIKLCNKFGIPLMVNLIKEEKNKILDLPSNKRIEVKQYNYPQLKEFNRTYNNKIYIYSNELVIKNVEINLNDFIIECYYLYHLFSLSNDLLTKNYNIYENGNDDSLYESYTNNEKRYKYLQNQLEKIFFYHYTDLDHPFDLKYIEKKLSSKIDNFKQNTIDNLKCNNIKISNYYNENRIELKNKTNNYELKLKTYSSISTAVLYLLLDKYYNKIILNEYNQKCYHCNTNAEKLHRLRFENNIYDISIYLCNGCFKKWSNKCNNQRVKKSNSKNSINL
ncbi:unknown [Clostridium sp. CAG:914]|nr:unknown [Clostridium sp. CAG:914]